MKFKVGDVVVVRKGGEWTGPFKVGMRGVITKIRECDINVDRSCGNCGHCKKAIKWENGRNSPLRCYAYGTARGWNNFYILKKFKPQCLKDLLEY